MIEDYTKSKMPFDVNAVKAKGLKIYTHLKELDQAEAHSTRSHDQEFFVTKGWLENFKSRFALHSLKIQDDFWILRLTASVDVETARKYLEELSKIIEEGGYTANQVFNADETGLN